MATETTKLTFVEGAAASTPAATRVVIYSKSDGLMYSKDDAGTETLMSAGGGGIPASILDAKGDLIAATAADTAARVAVGANGTLLEAASGATPGMQWTRTLRGKIQGSNGAVLQGTGFTSVRDSLGNYTVTITSAFPSAPIVVAMVTHTGTASRWVTADAITTTSIHFYVSSNAAFVDVDFSFIAMVAS